MMTKREEKLGSIGINLLIVMIPVVTGLISSRMTIDQMESFGQLNQPPLSPPAWLFPVAWSILYVLMGIALVLIVRSKHEYKTGAIALFISQLIMNFMWSPVFFNMKDYVMAFFILLVMWMTTVILTFVTWKINKLAAYCLMPYIAWMMFAAYLNIGVAMLNS